MNIVEIDWFLTQQDNWYVESRMHVTKLGQKLLLYFDDFRILTAHWNWESFVAKIQEKMVSGPFIVFTRHALMEETFFTELNETVQIQYGIDVSQL